MNLHQFRHIMGQVFVVPILALAILAIALAIQIRSSADTVRQIQSSDRRIARVTLISKLIVDQETGLRGFQVTGDPRFLEPYRQAEHDLSPVLNRVYDRMQHGPTADPQQAAMIADVRDTYNGWKTGFVAGIINAATAGTEFRDPELNMRGKQQMDHIRADLTNLTDLLSRQRTERIDRWQGQVKLMLRVLFGLALAAALLIGLFVRSRLHMVSAAFRGSIEEAQRRAAESFRSEQELRTTLSSIGDGVIQCDLNGRVQMMNPVAEDLTRWPLAEAVGASIADVFPVINERTRAALESPVMKVLRLGHTIKLSNHALLVRRDGTEVDIADSGAPIRDKEGTMLGVVMVFRDVSIERRSQEALIAHEKLVVSGRVAATIAHEIHNPLDAVQNILYLIRQGTGPAETDEYLRLAESELSRVTEISRAMLGMHREAISAVAIDLRNSLCDMLLLMERRFGKLGVQVTADLATGVEVSGYPGELKQVFSNLLANAAEAAGQGGTVHVELLRGLPHSADDSESVPPGALIRILDNGPGIDPATLAKLFEPFFTTKGEGGTGLGLWVSRGIAAKHGGTLTLSSNQSGANRGTLAEVYLPLSQESPNAQSFQAITASLASPATSSAPTSA